MITGNQGTTLYDAALLAAWPTPAATELGNTLESYQAMKANMASGPRTAVTHLSQAAQLATWATPKLSDQNGIRQADGRRGLGLNDQASWSTPSARDWKDTPGMATTGTNPDGSERTRIDQLPRQAQLAGSGSPVTGSRVSTAKRGRLNPAHSRWLMGYPPVWDACAVTAMPSSRKLPPK